MKLKGSLRLRFSTWSLKKHMVDLKKKPTRAGVTLNRMCITCTGCRLSTGDGVHYTASSRVSGCCTPSREAGALHSQWLHLLNVFCCGCYFLNFVVALICFFQLFILILMHYCFTIFFSGMQGRTNQVCTESGLGLGRICSSDVVTMDLD